jgi:hypothetical protein
LSDDDARRRHYGRFYRLDDAPVDRPIGLIVGNCQAESLRIALGDGEVELIRMPAVHEIVADDLPHLEHWLARAAVLVTQPVRDDYHGMPLGSRQLAAAVPATAVVCRVPVIRFAGLYPFHAIVRPPSDPSLTPPLVAYHDLRVLAEAAGLGMPAAATPSAVHAVAEESLEQLRRREIAHDTVVVSDLFARPDFAQMRTLNHPGNPVWSALAVRVAERLGLADAPPPLERPLLNSVHAPRERSVIDAWGLDDEPIDSWGLGALEVPVAQVREEHLRWYERNPEVVEAGLARHATALTTLGLR